MAELEVGIRRVNTTVKLGSRLDRPAVVLTLLIGAFLRFWNLTALGLEHDEVANWLIDRSILAGQHGIYFQEAYGHEAGFHYLQTLFVALIGDNALALRLPAAFLGVVLIAVSYTFVKELYNRQVALLAALIVATTFFPIFYSRLALRAIMLPVFSGLSGYLFWRGYNKELSSSKELSSYLMAGIFAGLATYTYMASRVIPIFFALFFAYLLIWQRKNLRFTFYVLLPYLLISAPLFIYLALFPSAEFRISEINYPLEQLRQLNVRPVLENAWRILGVWGWKGDPLWRQNVAGMPIFTLPLAIVFYAGLLFMLWRRQLRDVFVLLWIATATIPSIVTIDAPSTIRMINMLPLLGVPIGIVIFQLWERFAEKEENGNNLWRSMLGSTFVIVAGYSAIYQFELMQIVWSQNAEVQFVWQQSLTSMAEWLDEQTDLQDVTILGWTPDTMDAPTLELALLRDDLTLRFAGRDGGLVEAFVIADEQNAVLLRPTTPELPLHSALVDFLVWETESADFIRYNFQPSANLDTVIDHFGDEWTFNGSKPCAMEGDICHFATIWRVTTEGDAAQSIFVHVLDETGAILNQSDIKLNGRATWQVGDFVIVGHSVDLANAADVRAGIYHSQPPYERLLTPSGADSVQLSMGSQR